MPPFKQSFCKPLLSVSEPIFGVQAVTFRFDIGLYGWTLWAWLNLCAFVDEWVGSERIKISK
jgi:hypothetical protein